MRKTCKLARKRVEFGSKRRSSMTRVVPGRYEHETAESAGKREGSAQRDELSRDRVETKRASCASVLVVVYSL